MSSGALSIVVTKILSQILDATLFCVPLTVIAFYKLAIYLMAINPEPLLRLQS